MRNNKKCPARRQPDGAAKKHWQGFFTGIIPHPWSNGKEESMVKTMTIEEAAKYLRENGVKISKETLSDGIQAEKLPFGVCIETGRSRVFMIFKRLVDRWLEEREEKR